MRVTPSGVVEVLDVVADRGGADSARGEVFVVDDGSVDQTAALVRQEFGRDPRVRLLLQTNHGKPSALNHGLSEVAGEVIRNLVENGQPVEYGEPLFGIHPHRKK